MSLDALFQQILITEQHLSEQTQQLKDGIFTSYLLVISWLANKLLLLANS